MFSNLTTLLPLLVSNLLLSTNDVAEQRTKAVLLRLSPASCVVLQQGGRCYATVDIQWQSVAPEELCLHVGLQKLHCWQSSREGRLRYEFAEYDSQQLQMLSTTGIEAEAIIKVLWVNENPRVKRYWRLF